MKLSALLIFSLFVCTIHAQIDQATASRRASAAPQVTPDHFGGFAEVFFHPNRSVWTTIGYRQDDRTLGFGEDTTSGSFFSVPLEKITFNNIQQSITLRAGVRFYEAAKKDKWSFWYSPVIGFSNLTAPSEEYQIAYLREDLNRISAIGSLKEAKRTMELGGEIGSRWMFWRKPQTETGLFLEASALLLGQRSLIIGRTNREHASLELRAAVGFTF